ncbi:MAG: T9SS type A sorting domain-containing protein [Muribaculaceae bacterium]|nr:T9SS type A sorting domain-containing protein [Muribaculaceae bacterium]
MKKNLLIGLLCIMLAAPAVMALPDGNVQRIEQTRTTGSNVQGGVGRITLIAGNASEEFSIYSITGQLLRVVQVPADSLLTIDVPKGFYIVRCGNQWSRKVVVR